MHWIKLNIGDYSKKAGRLTVRQDGVYFRLMMACYDREAFPTAEQALEWTWVTEKEDIEAVEFVLKRFFVLMPDGTYEQGRIHDELENYQANKVTNKRIAKEREAKRRENSTKRVKKARTVNEAPPNQNQEPEPEPRTKSKDLSAKPDVSTDVFNYWVRVMGKQPNQTKLTAKRKKNIQARLKDYTPEQIFVAIDHCAADAWSMGANERNTPFNDIELICRSGEKLEQFMELDPTRVVSTGKTRDRNLHDELTDTSWAD